MALVYTYAILIIISIERVNVIQLLMNQYIRVTSLKIMICTVQLN